MATTRIYVPRETSAVSVGADEVAVAIAREAKQAGVSIELVRNGSWGASWLNHLSRSKSTAHALLTAT